MNWQNQPLPLFKISMEQLFKELYFAQTEDDVDKVINNQPDIFKGENWYPLGGNENNFGVIENQQSNPIAALIEKITNSIDAVLMKKCLEVSVLIPNLNKPLNPWKKQKQDFLPITETGICLVREKNRQKAFKLSLMGQG